MSIFIIPQHVETGVVPLMTALTKLTQLFFPKSIISFYKNNEFNHSGLCKNDDSIEVLPLGVNLCQTTEYEILV